MSEFEIKFGSTMGTGCVTNVRAESAATIRANKIVKRGFVGVINCFLNSFFKITLQSSHIGFFGYIVFLRHQTQSFLLGCAPARAVQPASIVYSRVVQDGISFVMLDSVFQLMLIAWHEQ